MKIIKRSGKEVEFDQNKITNAINKANLTVEEKERLSQSQIGEIVDNITKLCKKTRRATSVEEIQDMVERGIMQAGAFSVAKTT